MGDDLESQRSMIVYTAAALVCRPKSWRSLVKTARKESRCSRTHLPYFWKALSETETAMHLAEAGCKNGLTRRAFEMAAERLSNRRSEPVAMMGHELVWYIKERRETP